MLKMEPIESENVMAMSFWDRVAQESCDSDTDGSDVIVWHVSDGRRQLEMNREDFWTEARNECSSSFEEVEGMTRSGRVYKGPELPEEVDKVNLGEDGEIKEVKIGTSF
jgi:hypothetical protein